MRSEGTNSVLLLLFSSLCRDRRDFLLVRAGRKKSLICLMGMRAFLTALILVTAVAEAKTPLMASTGAEGKSPPERVVTVYSNTHDAVPYQIEGAAQDEASKMFAEIGVRLVWLFGNPSPSDADSLAIETVAIMPATFMPGALAYALPSEGIHIRILWDRIKGYAAPREVLAHVMVHEIAHILQGETTRHSDEGIMMAHWGSATCP